MRILLALLLCASCGKDSSAPAPTAETSVQAPSPAPSTAETSPAIDAGGQSFLEGMRALCHSIDAVPGNVDAAEHQRQVARWIEAKVTNVDVRELFTIIGDMPASQRPGMLGAAAAKAGLPTCALAER